MKILVGDIGGTSSRFALARDPANPGSFSDLRVMRDAEHHGLADAIESYLALVKERPTSAVLAIAGPVGDGEVKLTNLDWHFSASGLTRELGCPTLIINDFEAVACALPYIAPADLRQIGPTALRPAETKAALGPGTGLGVACLARWNERWIPIPSEGGHSELASTTPEEVELFAIIRRDQGRVSAEDILSGPGFARLHAARKVLHGFASPSTTPVELTVSALSGGDPEAVKTAQMLLRFLARFAGDVALMFAAVGGVYLHGGVTQKLSPLIDAQAFRAEFEDKEPHAAWLRAIGTIYIADPTPALVGCAAMALDRFQ